MRTAQPSVDPTREDEAPAPLPRRDRPATRHRRHERADSPARVVRAFDGDLRPLRLRDLMFLEQVGPFAGKTSASARLMHTCDDQQLRAEA